MGAPVSGAGGCPQIRPELGVYVPGAITPAGRAVAGRHLVSCPRYRDEVAGLAGIPAMLRRVPAAAAELSGQRPGGDGPGPQPGLPDGLLRQVAAVRRQRLAQRCLTRAESIGAPSYLSQPTLAGSRAAAFCPVLLRCACTWRPGPAVV